VVGDVDGGRLFRREVPYADDVDPGRAAMYTVSKSAPQRDTY
jgi:hypothetical protein